MIYVTRTVDIYHVFDTLLFVFKKLLQLDLSKKSLWQTGFLAAVLLVTTQSVFASGGEASAEKHAAHFGLTFLMFATLLIAGKIGNFVEKFGQPAVIGELFAGIVLAAGSYFGIHFFGDIIGNNVIAFIAQFGALLLLFSIGLESNLAEMKKVGLRALLVALIGVVVPFGLGAFILTPLFFEGASFNTQLFVGASLVATSVGITASVFRSLGIEKTRAAKTVIGAAVIDDVLGLLVLAIVSSLAAGEQLSASGVGILVVKAFGFLAGALILGGVLAKPLSKLFSKIHTGLGMKVTLAVGFALVFGYLAELFGLEPIIGAFAAGLMLDAVHFDSFADSAVIKDLKSIDLKSKADREAVSELIRHHRHASIEDLVNNIGYIFIPIFFVYAGLQIDFGSLLQPNLYVIAVIVSVVATLGKLVAGFAAQGSMREKMLVGFSMVPRGEVGLVFAATGSSLGVLNADEFSVIVLVIIITTFIAPFAIKKFAGDKPNDDLPKSRYKNLFKTILEKKSRFTLNSFRTQKNTTR